MQDHNTLMHQSVSCLFENSAALTRALYGNQNTSCIWYAFRWHAHPNRQGPCSWRLGTSLAVLYTCACCTRIGRLCGGLRAMRVPDIDGCNTYNGKTRKTSSCMSIESRMRRLANVVPVQLEKVCCGKSMRTQRHRHCSR